MEKKLIFWDCMEFCIGQIIGSGIMVLTGIVIGFTCTGGRVRREDPAVF